MENEQTPPALHDKDMIDALAEAQRIIEAEKARPTQDRDTSRKILLRWLTLSPTADPHTGRLAS